MEYFIDVARTIWSGAAAFPLMLTAGLVGLLIRVSLSSVGQRWAATYHHTMTYILLPVTAFTITRVIAGNISLSLGMIGALSIVRFRNPVRNPFELVIFFALVTIGVAVSADPALGVALGIFVMFVVYGVAFYERIAGRNRRQPFAISFAEGETSHTISVSTRGRILLLDESLGLTSRFEDNSNDECSYTLSFRTRQELDEMSDSLRSVRPSVLSIETRIGQSPA